MTLQQLLGELLALSNAYPPDTEVSISVVSHGYSQTVERVEVASGDSVRVTLHGAAD